VIEPGRRQRRFEVAQIRDVGCITVEIASHQTPK
jgi:hypothetical protein